MIKKFLDSLPKRFGHRFEETEKSLKNREWVKNTKIDKVLKQILDECIYYDCELYCDLYLRHHFYCAATAPHSFEVWDFEKLKRALEGASAGDFIEVWSLTNDPKYYIINCPNKDGLFPKKGSY